jgi:predicted dehydrogenase
LSKTLGIGMIGVGAIADLHAAGYMESHKAKIVAVADVDSALAKSKAMKFGAENHYGSVEELLKDEQVDAVDICVPNALHCPIAVKACESGKHVLVEKPMARNVEECDAIIRAARKAGVNLMVNHSSMFFPPFSRCKQLVTDGGVGRLIRMRATHMGSRYRGWRTDPEQAGGGVLIEGVVHQIYLTRWYLGEIRRVSAMAGRTDDQVAAEDIAMILLEADDDVFGVIDANLNGPYPLWDDRLEIVGTTGMLIATGSWDQIIRSPPVLHYRDGLWHAYREKKDYGVGRPEIPNEIEWDTPKAFVYATQEFVNSILECREPKVSGHDGRRAIEIVQACYDSAKTQQVVSLS